MWGMFVLQIRSLHALPRKLLARNIAFVCLRNHMLASRIMQDSNISKQTVVIYPAVQLHTCRHNCIQMHNGSMCESSVCQDKFTESI